ncbi:MAG TPA: MltA domain-containing protein [Phycisphaerae bacterium]|nr:MltA domain-containing protein [Phycisphaerae bacterium]
MSFRNFCGSFPCIAQNSPALRLALVTMVVVATGLAGCQKKVEPLPMTKLEKNYDRPLPPGEFALRKLTDESQYPNFGEGWYKAKGVTLREAVAESISYLTTPSSRKYFPMGPITHETAVATLPLFLEVLDQASSPEELNALIKQYFDVYISIGCDDEGTVLFTGYYSPIFDGSMERTDHFQYPLYKIPPEIQKDEEGNVVGGPWRSREEIEQQHLLDGQELVYLGDRFETYVVTVQGSGFLRMPDGNLYEVGYAGNNGHEYTPIGKMLVADGKIERHRLSLATMIKHFEQYPDEMDQYLYQNERFIFFRESSGGPYGCLGRRVTPFHSIATDKEIFPRACMAFLDTRIPDETGDNSRAFRNFALDQDRGAAIRAPGRCDIYMGVGDRAGQMAGFTYNEGKLYYIFAKEGVTTTGQLAGDMESEGQMDEGMGQQR